MIQLRSIILFILLSNSCVLFGQNQKHKDDWFVFSDTSKDECGYINQKGDTVVSPGKYKFCFTDTFRTYAIVVKEGFGFVAIDKQQNVLYKVFPYDNGPDYASDGLFRIVQNQKIGYADAATGKVAIKPQFGCAYPFKKGVAQVGLNCTTHSDDGEHHYWTSSNWFYIDKRGRKVEKRAKTNHEGIAISRLWRKRDACARIIKASARISNKPSSGHWYKESTSRRLRQLVAYEFGALFNTSHNTSFN